MRECTLGSHRSCREFESGDVRLVVTTLVGPRILGCFIGGDGDNLMAVLPNRPMKGVGTGFRLYGGHRLWHSPEDLPRTYQPDSQPVTCVPTEHGMSFSSGPEAATGIGKTIEIEPLDKGVFVVSHRLRNHGLWEVEAAPWALTMLAPGGLAVIPQGRDPKGNPYAPDRQLTMWPYSSFSDPRLGLGEDYIFLRQDPAVDRPVKIGFDDQSGWVAYVRNGKALVKYFDVYGGDDRDYPDGGCSVESYCCRDFCEVETLGVLDVIPPGEEVEHVEYWQGIGGLPEIRTEEDFTRHVLPRMLLEERPEEGHAAHPARECTCGGPCGKAPAKPSRKDAATDR